MKLRFFLSSSSEQLSIAEALESNLENVGHEPTLWTREAHRASEYNLEALLRNAASSDFAVFVFAPDDDVVIRGEKFAVVRDNVLFELGLFIGVLGRNRCLIVRAAQSSMRIPTDLEGLTVLRYDTQRSDKNAQRSLGPVTTKIVNHARMESISGASQFTDNDLKLLHACKDISMPSNQYFRVFGAMPIDWDDKLCMRFLRLQEQGLIKTTGPTEIEATRKGNLLTEEGRVLQAR